MKFTVQRYDAVPDEPRRDNLDEDIPGNVSPEDNEGPSSDRGGGGDDRDLSDSPLPDKADLVSPESSEVTVESAYTSGALDMADIGDPMARRGRLFAQRHTRRLVFKDGECNISLGHIKQRRRRYLGDIFTTLLDMRWRYVLLMFMAAFVVSWLLFALIWWAICISHEDHLHTDDPNWEPCVANVYDFATALLFSVETQHTIGYGSRAMEPKCPEAIFILMLQSCLGVFIQSLMTGIIFAKMSRPKRRGHTMMFCKNAVICQRDGEHVLLFRVADMRKSHIVDANIRCSLVRNRITKEGELIPLAQVPLPCEAENATDNYIFLLWPTTITHIINESSPLYGMSAESLLSEHFEIIIYLEGTVESTGMTTQVRTSYLPSEIHWGHRLAPLVTYQKDANGDYKVDYAQFHKTIPMERMPECSAKTFAENEASNRRGSEAGPLPVLTHHMSFTHGLPGIARNRAAEYQARHASLHAYTVGAHHGWANGARKRTEKGSDGLHRRRSYRQRFITRLNGMVRSNSLDAFAMRNRRRPVDIMSGTQLEHDVEEVPSVAPAHA